MKYPKLRNGANAVGEALFRALQRTGAPFVSASGADYGANKYGNGGEVYGGVEDGYYILGTMSDFEDTSKSSFKTTSSKIARGAFNDLGTRVIEGIAGYVAMLTYLGGGRGMIVDPVAAGDPPKSIHLVATRYGRTYKPIYTFLANTDAAAGNDWVFVPGSTTHAEDGTTQISWGVGVLYTDGSATTFSRYIFTKDNAKTFNQLTLSYGLGGFKTGMANVARLSASTLFMVVPVYIGSGNTDSKASLTYLLTQNGDAYDLVDGGDLLSMLQITPVAGNNTAIALWSSSVQAIPLVDGTCIIFAGAEYYDGRYAGGPELETGFYAFRFDGTTFTFLDKVAIPGLTTLRISFSYGLCGEIPFADVRSEDTDDVMLAIAAPDGTGWTYKPMPYGKRWTGYVVALDGETLVCPMYSDELAAYVLMQSKDFGDTWVKRATITKNAPAPKPVPDIFEPKHSMARFFQLACLRKNGVSANTYLGAPWIGNDRITPPWEL